MKSKQCRGASKKERRRASFCLCGAQTLLGYLHALQAEIDGVRQGTDEECVHRMRVATRRLRSCLPLFTACIAYQDCARWRKRLRRLTRALGAARDLDVQLGVVTSLRKMGADELEQAGLARVAVRLQQQRQALQPAVSQALQRFVESGVSAEMEAVLGQVVSDCKPYADERLGRAVYRRMRKAILTRLKKLEAYEPYVRQPGSLVELHAMRMAAKRLRYTLQAFAPLYGEALHEPIQASRTLQDLLGDIHDCDVWAAQIPQFLEDERARTEAYFGDAGPFTALVPGIVALQHNREHFREQRYQAFVAFWQASQAQGLWEQLRQALAAPLQHAKDEDATPGAENTEAAAEPAQAC